MASSADTIIQNLLAGTGYGRTPGDFQAQADQHNLAQQSIQHNNFALQADQQQQQQDQNYSRDVGAWIAAGSPPEALPALAVKYPKQYEAIKAGWDLKDKAQQTADLNFFGQAYAAANNGRTDLVKQQITQRRDAEKQAGGDTSELDDLLGQFDTDPKSALENFKSAALAHIYAGDKDGFAKAFGLGADKTTIVHPGDIVLGADNKPIYTAPDKKAEPFHYTLKDANGVEHEFIYDPGSGEPLPQGAQPVGTGTGIPRSVRNNNPGNIEDGSFAKSQPGYQGSDGRFAQFVSPEAGAAAQTALLSQYGAQGRNTVAKIVSKWAPSSDGNNVGAYAKFVAQKLGVHPNQALDMTDPKTLSGLQMAMAAFEGGSQSKSNGPVAGSASSGGSAALPGARQLDSTPFATAADGDVSNIQQGNIATVPPAARGIVQSIIDGRFPITSRMTSPKVIQYFAMANAVDPTVDATTYVRRAQTARAFAPNGKQGTQLISGKTLIDHLYDLAQLSDKLGGSSLTPLNSVHNWYLNKTSDPTLSAYESSLSNVADEQPKFLAGTATIPGIAQVRKDYDATKGPEGRKAAIAATLNQMDGRFRQLLDSYSAGMNKSADISELLGQQSAKLDALRQWAADPNAPLPQIGKSPVGSPLGTAGAVEKVAAPSRASTPHVATMAQAMALPSGTKFIDPHGVARVRP